MPREGVGVGLGAQVVTYRGPFSPESFKNGPKRGTPYSDHFWEEFAFPGTHPSVGSQMSILSPLSHPKGTKIALQAEILRRGS